MNRTLLVLTIATAMLIYGACTRKGAQTPTEGKTPPAIEKKGVQSLEPPATPEEKRVKPSKEEDGKSAAEERVVTVGNPPEDGKAVVEEKVIVEGKPVEEAGVAKRVETAETLRPPFPEMVDIGLGFKHIPISEVEKRIRRFVQVPIPWDKSLLTEKEIQLVRTLIRAAKVMDELFWLQASADGLEWRKRLSEMTEPAARTLYHYLLINYGPYDRLNGLTPFLGDKLRPEGGNFYPEDMTRLEFNEWLAANPSDEAAFKSNFTVIRRDGDRLVAVPYSKAYETQLAVAKRLLLEAADLAENPSLKRYLRSRAEAFTTNDYFQSDVDWVDLDSKIEVTIGPYEVYEDRLFGYKAAFEAFVTIKDPVASGKLDTFKKWVDRLERNLPIPDEHKNFKRGSASPLVVADVVFTGGDARAGVQTLAFNLPNDERVRKEKGSKKVILRNVGDAKFQVILRPIAQRVLDERLLDLLHHEAWLTHTLLHEISHGLGPGIIQVGGAETTVNLALKEVYPALEEAKADTLGFYNSLYLIDQGVIVLRALRDGAPDPEGRVLSPDEAKQATIATFLAGIFRSTRFGTEEAHGKANLVIFNYLFEKGAFAANPQGRMTFDYLKVLSAVRELAHDILMLQATGDYSGAKAFLEKYGKVSPVMASALASLDDLPVDIEPIYDLP